MEMTSSESASLEHKSVPQPSVVGTGVKAFNVTDRLPPNLVGMGNVMGDRVPYQIPHFPSFILKISERYMLVLLQQA